MVQPAFECGRAWLQGHGLEEKHTVGPGDASLPPGRWIPGKGVLQEGMYLFQEFTLVIPLNPEVVGTKDNG